ncbi:hypothetical protein [Comamonas sp. JC664]|uniref:hypothetical protein n=1 Tax=Comamonas sp. JC664 TaxID=2801917 RepID=UPI00174AEF74|nr:hypothetical protein [Comamonas sp. JC664]MBL0692941.1 hypothetical protein [Comamonas sp. JC664]
MTNRILVAVAFVVGVAGGWAASILTETDTKIVAGLLGGGLSATTGFLASELSAMRRRKEARHDRLVFENLGARHKAYAELNKALLVLERYYTLYLPRESEFQERDYPYNFSPLRRVEEFDKAVSEISLWLDIPTQTAIRELTGSTGIGISVALNIAGANFRKSPETQSVPTEMDGFVESHAEGILKQIQSIKQRLRQTLGINLLDEFTQAAAQGLQATGRPTPPTERS